MENIFFRWYNCFEISLREENEQSGLGCHSKRRMSAMMETAVADPPAP